MAKKEWDLVATEFNGTSITCNTEHGYYEFREEENDGTPIRNLTVKEAADELVDGFSVSGPCYEGVMKYLEEEGYVEYDKDHTVIL